MLEKKEERRMKGGVGGGCRGKCEKMGDDKKGRILLQLKEKSAVKI